ncbi:MAG TPA: rhodanese-like domain-containing protein [Bacteroidia bacterium]|nr:rhodanese-like domain-containing protein [Bacteroidia bacterium]
MKHFFSSIFLSAFLLGSLTIIAQQVINLTPKEMFSQSKKAKAVYLDVRTPQEWTKGHIKSATHLDIFRDDFEAELKKLDKNKTYYVYCAVGGRSGEATVLMSKLGFKHIYNMQGGFKAWEKEGLPSVK